MASPCPSVVVSGNGKVDGRPASRADAHPSEVQWASRRNQMIEGSCLCGAVRWTFEGVPDGATACNCTACRRYGVLWGYDYEGEGIKVTGPAKAYARGKALTFNFCPTCGCVAFWRGLRLEEDGR